MVMDFVSKIVSGNIDRIKRNISNSFVQDLDVEKGFDDELEKGKWNVGDQKFFNGNMHYVAELKSDGSPRWRRVKKGSGGSNGSSAASSTPSQNNIPTSSAQKNSNDVKKLNIDIDSDKIGSLLATFYKYGTKEDYQTKLQALQVLIDPSSNKEFWDHAFKVAQEKINERMLKLRSDLDELKNSKNTPSSNNASNNNKEKTIDKKQTNKNSTFAKNVVDKIKKVLKNTTISNDQLQKLENAISNDEENAKKILSIKFPKTKDVDLKSPESEAIKVVDLGNYEMICRTYKSYNFNISRGKSDPLVLENYSITLRNKVKDSKIIRHDSSWIPGFYDKEDNQQKCIIGALYSYYRHKENF